MEKKNEKLQNTERSSQRSRRVLVVEDSKALNRMICRTLERDGFSVNQAFDGASALTLASIDPDSIMLLDYVLPDMTAPQVVEQLRAQACELPFIMMTGQGDERVAVDMMKLGARDYIIKQGNFLETLPRILQRVMQGLAQQERVVQAELAQRESERRFREVLENARLIALMFDCDGRVTFCNDYFLEITGWTREEVLGCSWFEQFLSPDLRAQIQTNFGQALTSTDTSGASEYEILTKQGQRRIIAWNRILLRDTSGTVIGMNSLGEDITERKHSEQRQQLTAKILSLLNSTEEQTGIIHNILGLLKEFSGVDAVGIRLQHGEDFPYYEANGFSEEFLTHENSLCVSDENDEIARDTTGHAILDCICGLVISGRTDPSRPFFTEGGSFWINDPKDFFQLCSRCHCVQSGYESIALVPLRAGDEIIGLLQLNHARKNAFSLQTIQFFEEIGSSIGITITRKQTEDHLLQLRKAIETMHLGVTISDLDRRIVYTNPADASMHGYREEELIGQKAAIFAPVELQQPLVLEEVEKNRNWIRETVNIRKDGTRFFVQLSSDIVKDPDGRPIAIVTTCEDITERKRAEEMITQERNLLRTLIDNLPDYIFVKDTEGRFLINNIAHALFLGAVEQDDLIGMRIVDYLPKEMAEQDLLTDLEVLQNGVALLDQEHMSLSPNGRAEWRLVSKIPLGDQENAIIGLVGISRDISEQKRTQAALKAQAEELEERVKELNCLFQLSHVTEDDTLSFDEIFDQAVNLLPPAWKYPDSACARICVHDKQFMTQNFSETPWRQESRILSNNTAIGSVEVCYVEAQPDEYEGPFLLEERSLLNMIAERLGELIDRKRAEETIRESRKFLQSTLDSLAAHIAILDEQGMIVEVNASWKHFADTNEMNEENYCVGQNYLRICETANGDFSAGSVETANGIRTVIDREQETFYTEYPCHSPTTRRWFAMRVTRFHSHGVMRIVIAHEDISERKQAEEALQKTLNELESRVQERTSELISLNAQLERASRLKDEFLATMSHELRTPLNAILGYTQILKSAENLTVPQREALETVKNSGDHLLSMINEILDLSKIEAGQMQLQLTDMHLPHFLRSLADMIRIRAEQKDIIFQYEAEPELPEGIRIDEKRLREILLNLLGNAVKFTDKGKVTFRVRRVSKDPCCRELETASSLVSSTCLLFEVEDTGSGIAPEHVQDIFLPFHQLDKYRHVIEGTGLGLTISKKLVTMMGSELHLESRPGKGTRFWFTIAVQEIFNIISEKEVMFPKIVGYSAPPKTVLVIDDVLENRAILTSMLLPLGFRMIEATSADEGLECALHNQPDIILLDLLMPEIDGFECVRRIRCAKPIADIVVIAISASAFHKVRQRSLQAGCNDFLAKPFQMNELLNLLEKYLSLEWVYEGAEKRQMVEERNQPVPKEMWQQLSPENQQELLERATRGNVKEILKQLDLIEAHGEFFLPLTQKLRGMAKRFEVDQIVEYVRQQQQNCEKEP